MNNQNPTPCIQWMQGVGFFYASVFRNKFIFQHDGKLLVKRIAAVEGETIERNGAILTVLESCYYVLGDNAEHSYDSRFWLEPFVEGKHVVAKLFCY